MAREPKLQENNVDRFREQLAADLGTGDDLTGLNAQLQARILAYHEQVFESSIRDFRLLSDFQRAMREHEIFFYLQPQCRVSTRCIVGAEALARWRKKDGTWVSPVDFIPVLEKYNMVAELDQYLWEEICAWLRRIADMGITPVPISVNVSRSDILSIDVPACLSSLVKKYDLPLRYLKVEITESAYVEDMETVKKTVTQLRELGFLVLMDDFGSGYSSLNMLTHFNVDIIKLDAQFLQIDSSQPQKGTSIVESIINMTKTLGTPVIVEGVENERQVNFLSDLGCRYMQGYYFYRPMSTADFEALLQDDKKVDHRGFVFKANRQLHTREFLDSNIYSDAMLNNILGPVCFYNWQGDNVDIIRFNQQFYLMVGLEAEVLEARRYHIQDYFIPEDVADFFEMLAKADADRVNGATGVFRIYKPNGTIFWIGLHVYYMEEDANGKKFYASAQDKTELQFVNMDLPGAYYRCTADDDCDFLYIGQNFQEMTGFTDKEIRNLFDNKLINMVHPADRALLDTHITSVTDYEPKKLPPYRIRHKEKGYIYVVENDRLTDKFGPLTWQCVMIEVTEMMRLRNQMRLLTEFFEDSIVFVHETEQGTLRYEVVVHGLEKKFGIDKEAFEQMLNDGSFLGSFDLPPELKRRELYWENIDDLSVLSRTATLRLAGRQPIELLCRFRRIHDTLGDVGCVIVFSIV